MRHIHDLLEPGAVAAVSLAELPTPVENIEALSKTLGAEVWVKRDDLSSSIYGGNKVRKLEFLLADAKARGCERVLTIGGIGTNHGLATAIHAKEQGLGCSLILFHQPITPHVKRSLKLYHAYGASMELASSYMDRTRRVMIKRLKARILRRPLYYIPGGGSSPLGTIGFVNAALELAEQIKQGLMPAPKTIFCPLGSCGTMAGLALGLKIAGLDSRLIGVRVTPKIMANRYAVAQLAGKTLLRLKAFGLVGNMQPVMPADLNIMDDYYGSTYGLPTPEAVQAVAKAAQHGLRLETTYTGRAFAGLTDYAAKHPDQGPFLFWHTYNAVDMDKTADDVDLAALSDDFTKLITSTDGGSVESER
jgi:1-aminocyclopropane-1-carboxylate deaminase/D-cysteine desulfhydrase-like pyridoxal-dependent ACC family enzyme